MIIFFFPPLVQLRKRLSALELQHFAALLREYRLASNIQHFCSELLRLYGDQRKFLLLGEKAQRPHSDLSPRDGAWPAPPPPAPAATPPPSTFLFGGVE